MRLPERIFLDEGVSVGGPMQIDLLFACDENYAPYAGVVLRSVWQTRGNEEQFRVWFISDGISATTQKQLKDWFPQMEITFFSLPDGFMAQVPVQNKHLSRAAYARLALGSVLPPEVTRVIYLDCDLLVRRPLGELWTFDLGDKIVAGVEDWGVYLIRKQGMFFFPPGEAYIGSGLLLVDVQRWREHRCEEKCLAYAASPAYPLRFEDQDILNFALRGRVALLPPQWDVVLHLSKEELRRRNAPEEWVFARENPFVIHFATFNKPWLKACSLPYAEEFQAHMRALGLRLQKLKFRIKITKLCAYWRRHPVFFLKPKFWVKWREKGWGSFF